MMISNDVGLGEMSTSCAYFVLEERVVVLFRGWYLFYIFYVY